MSNYYDLTVSAVKPETANAVTITFARCPWRAGAAR